MSLPFAQVQYVFPYQRTFCANSTEYMIEFIARHTSIAQSKASDLDIKFNTQCE